MINSVKESVRNILLLAITIVSMNSNIYAQNPTISKVDFAGRLDEDILRIVVNIQTPSGSTGTGFIINHEDKIYLITNKHMIGEWSLVDKLKIYQNIDIYFYPEDPTSIVKYTYELTDKTNNILASVKLHPDDDVDIAALDISNVYKLKSNIARNYFGTKALIKLENIGKETNIGFGSQIFTIGYPAGFKFSASNYPVAKSGYIASQLNGNLEIKIKMTNRLGVEILKKFSRKFYIVDGLIIGGNSGGPIVSPKDFYYKINNENKYESLMFRNFNYIIGIVSSGWKGTGLTIIYPIDYILDLIQN